MHQIISIQIFLESKRHCLVGFNFVSPPYWTCDFLNQFTGVYISQKYYICPPPFSQIFFPPSTVKISPFPPFFHDLPFNFTFFHYESSYFFSIFFLQPAINSYFWQNQIYTSLQFIKYKFLHVKNSSVTIVNGQSGLKFFHLPNGDLLFS